MDRWTHHECPRSTQAVKEVWGEKGRGEDNQTPPVPLNAIWGPRCQYSRTFVFLPHFSAARLLPKGLCCRRRGAWSRPPRARTPVTSPLSALRGGGHVSDCCGVGTGDRGRGSAPRPPLCTLQELRGTWGHGWGPPLPPASSWRWGYLWCRGAPGASSRGGRAPSGVDFRARGAGAAAGGPPGSAQPPAQERGLRATGLVVRAGGRPPPSPSHPRGYGDAGATRFVPKSQGQQPSAAGLQTGTEPSHATPCATPRATVCRHPMLRITTPKPPRHRAPPGAHPGFSPPNTVAPTAPVAPVPPVWVQTMAFCAEVSRCFQSRMSSLCQHYTIIS